MISPRWILVSVVALLGCEESRPPPRMPPPMPAPAPLPPAAEAPPPSSMAPPPEAGRVTLSPALLVGGNRMSQGSIDQATKDFVTAFNRDVSYFRQCYAPALQQNPALRGELTAEVTLNADGSVYNLLLKSTTISDQRAVDCSLEAFRRVKWASFSGELFAATASIKFEP